MKVCTKCNIEKPLNAFWKASQYVDGYMYWCTKCTKEYREENKETLHAAKKIYYKRNKETILEGLKENYSLRQPRVLKYNKEYYQNNKEKEAKRKAKYRKDFPDKVLALNAKRRAFQLQATPPWLTKEQLSEMELFYTAARIMTVATGIKYHVDHVIPLQGRNVRGLHVPWNLQILTQAENISKSNKV